MKGNLRRTSRTKQYVILLAVGAVLVLLLMFVPRTVSSIASYIYTPILEIQTWFANSGDNVPHYFRDRHALITANQALEEQLVGSSGLERSLRRLEDENSNLRALLGATTTPRDGIMAGIISMPPQSPYDVLVIDKGHYDGVREGAPVFVAHDQVVGYVSAVHDFSASVVLVSTVGLESTVYILGPNIYTTAIGEGNGILRIGVPQGIALTEGDLVVLPALYSGVFGEISEVASSPTQPEQFGYVEISIPVTSFRWVYVGTDLIITPTFDAAKRVVDAVKDDLLQVDVPAGILVEVETATTSTTTAASIASSSEDTL